MPRVPETAFTEQEGVIKVATVVNDARCVWRETPTRDVGIDGQIEYIDPQGEATGRIVAIQVKSGPSYFEHASQVSVPYSPSSLHRRYWERFPLPVVLVLYEPSSDTAVWADARAALRARPDGPIHVPRRQVFDETGVLEALQAEGPLPVGPTDPSHLMWLLLAEEIDVGDCRVSFFDLFFQGLTNAASWAVYFGMDLFDEVVRAKLAVLRSRGGFFITAETYDFIDRYVGFLTAYDIARVITTGS